MKHIPNCEHRVRASSITLHRQIKKPLKIMKNETDFMVQLMRVKGDLAPFAKVEYEDQDEPWRIYASAGSISRKTMYTCAV